MVDNEGVDEREALKVAAWEFSGVAVEKDPEEDGGPIDPCPTFFMKEPKYASYFTRDASEGSDSGEDDQASADLQAMAVA